MRIKTETTAIQYDRLVWDHFKHGDDETNIGAGGILVIDESN